MTNETDANKNVVPLPVEKHFKLLSWNIDGLYTWPETLVPRTHGVIDVIKREKPDAVFLQEVIPQSLALIQLHLNDYECYAGNDNGYFVAILTRREVFKIQSYEVMPYPATRMGRNLLIVHTIYEDSKEIDLMTTHLESREPASNERMHQLILCFQKMFSASLNRIVLFDGDLNLRDKELQQLGGMPNGIFDLWVEMGQNEEHAYTWDMQFNTNLDFSHLAFRPRCRFDRIYYRPAISSTIKFQPVSFKLEGLEKISSIQRFCSDHWAIQAEFEL